MVVYKQESVSNLIRDEFVAVRITPETPEVFRTFAVNNVPTFIIVGADGFEYERCSGFLDADGLVAFCLLALGKVYYDRHEKATAQRYLERLLLTYPQSPYVPEGIFLRGICLYLISQDPTHLTESFLHLSENHPDSIWTKRSLVLHFHPSAVFDWDAECRQHRDYWDSQDAFAKCFATYFNWPPHYQVPKKDNR